MYRELNETTTDNLPHRMVFMPFGKFKGQPIADLPPKYLTWLLSQDWVADPLLSTVKELCRH